jgi:hypothetical protein
MPFITIIAMRRTNEERLSFDLPYLQEPAAVVAVESVAGKRNEFSNQYCAVH